MPIEESITLIEKLTPGEYLTSIGNITSPEHVREFVKDVKERVPEFAGKDWDEIEDKVLDALNEVIDEACKIIDQKEMWGATHSSFDRASLYECYHPSTGKFYISMYDWGDFDSGEGGVEFYLTRDKKDARRTFRETIKDIKEEYERYRE